MIRQQRTTQKFDKSNSGGTQPTQHRTIAPRTERKPYRLLLALIHIYPSQRCILCHQQVRLTDLGADLCSDGRLICPHSTSRLHSTTTSTVMHGFCILPVIWKFWTGPKLTNPQISPPLPGLQWKVPGAGFHVLTRATHREP
jgi:hypothetical protein